MLNGNEGRSFFTEEVGNVYGFSVSSYKVICLKVLQILAIFYR